MKADAGDVGDHYDPAQAIRDFPVKESQDPTLEAGWHHTWSPGSHSLFLFSRLQDTLSYTNPEPNVIFLFQNAGVTTAIQNPPLGPPFALNFTRDFTLYSAEAQQIWETPRHALIVGGRWQWGDVDTHSELDREISGIITNQSYPTSLERGDAYAYSSWQVFERLRLMAGVTYSHLRFPENADLPPISAEEKERDLVAPKVRLFFQPW